MSTRLRTFGFLGALTMLAVVAGAGVAHAGGCCGGGGGRAAANGGYGGGHTFGRTAYAGYSGVGMSCCSMGGMSMGAMSMAPAQANTAIMQGMPMGGYAAPAAVAAPAKSAAPQARYTCPMHPGVVSATPASCPYCGMALVRR